jgi:hypothetical protein
MYATRDNGPQRRIQSGQMMSGGQATSGATVDHHADGASSMSGVMSHEYATPLALISSGLRAHCRVSRTMQRHEGNEVGTG